MDVKIRIEQLLDYAQKKLNFLEDDVMLARNYLLDLLKLDSPYEGEISPSPIQEILDDMTAYAVENKLCEPYERLLFETRIMGIVTPTPSRVIETFDDIAAQSGIKASTDWFFNLCINSNYIRKVDIDKNLKWEFDGKLGKIKITINLSKPEKDPEEVKRAKLCNSGYPKCMLCPSNVGWAGNASKPARQTLRTIPIELNGENWFMQYSPYVYFDNHAIAFSEEHRPMHIDGNSFKRMVDFVKLFPHYFIGSNAALPIVGGSILAHDHYQGGNKVLPMLKAKARKYYKLEGYPEVNVSILDWYNSVVRIESKNDKDAVKVADLILSKWKEYSDESVDVIAFSEENGEKVEHNTVTPTLQINDNGEYSFALILRNNRTTKERPFGLFHPSEDLHNIKKESIGIIEAMGLFILPGRLSGEINAIQDILTGKEKLDFKELSNENNPLSKHLPMIAQLVQNNGTSLTADKAQDVVVEAVNTACEKILETTGVFKNDEKGQAAFDKFLKSCGLK